MKKRQWFLLELVFALVIVGLGFSLKLKLEKAPAEKVDVDWGVPVLNVTLEGVDLDTIKSGSKDIKYPGNKVTLSSNGEVEEFTDVEVKGRGNSTWRQNKKPFQLKFDEKTELLGMGKGKKWVLLANYLDETELRNATAFEIGKMLEMEFTPTGEFVELYVNDEYEGLYYLTRKTEISGNGVDLKTPDGILVELDNVYGKYEGCYYTDAEDCLTIGDVVDEESEGVVMEEFASDFNRMELALENGDYFTFTELADVESFAKYFLLSEFTLNIDSYLTSAYFYRDDGKIHAGPGWDFDMTFNNERWGVEAEPTSERVRRDESKEAEIFYQLMKIPEFQVEVNRVYDELMAGRSQELTITMRKMANKIKDAVQRDAVKWEKEKVASETERLIDWVWMRYQFMDQKYSGGGYNSTVNLR